VPPDLAVKGLTGEVVAARVLDRLSTMQQQTISSRAPSSYANNWGGDIKVQIPDTGVSIGEMNRYLRGWLGHETHITGEIYRTAQGLAITARAGSDASPTFTGTDADFDKLVQQAAESVYRSTQPYRYAVYLDAHNRAKEAQVIYQSLAASNSPTEQAWAYIGLDNQETANGRGAKAIEDLHLAVAIKPDLLLAYENLASSENTLQHDEQALVINRQIAALASQRHDFSKEESNIQGRLAGDALNLDTSLGDYRSAQSLIDRILRNPDTNNAWENARVGRVAICASLHDVRCTDAAWKSLPPPPASRAFAMLNRNVSRQGADGALERWSDVLARENDIVSALKRAGGIGEFFKIRGEYPLTAAAYARLGDFKTAHAEIDQSPLDCIICLRSRGSVASLERDDAGVAKWFGRAAKLAPSSPFVWTDWGQALLQRGQPAAAIAKLAIAIEKGPHFADPLEYWGEALMLQNRSDLALAKFEAAAALAPNWARLHLKWGEALRYAGKKDEAQKQFAAAAQLYLLSGERAELKRFH
jgi:tetratricopeptide (TPR) repeat protein